MVPTGIQALLPPEQQGMASQPQGMGQQQQQGMAQQLPPGPQQPSPNMGIGSAVGSVNEYVDMYQTDPNPLAQQYEADGDFLKLLALQKIKSLQEAFANDYAMQMAQMNAANGQDAPIATQVENEVMSNAMQGMGPPAGGSEGMLGLPIDNGPVMTGAGGGIVAFAGEAGSLVEAEKSLEDLLREKLSQGMGGTGRESPVTQYDLDQLEADKLRDAREANFAERQAMLAAQQDPDRRRKEGLMQAIHAAATTYGGVGEMGARIGEGQRRRQDAEEAFDLGVIDEQGAEIDAQLAELLSTQSERRQLTKDFDTAEDAALAQVLSSSTTLIQSQKQLDAALAQAAKATNQMDYVNWRVDLARITAGGELSPEQEAQERVDATEEYIQFSTDATGRIGLERIGAEKEQDWLVARQKEEEALVERYMSLGAGNQEYQQAMAAGDQTTLNRLLDEGMERWERRNPDPRAGAARTSTPPSLTMAELITANPGLTQVAVDALMSDTSEERRRLWNREAAEAGLTITAEEIIAAQSP